MHGELYRGPFDDGPLDGYGVVEPVGGSRIAGPDDVRARVAMTCRWGENCARRAVGGAGLAQRRRRPQHVPDHSGSDSWLTWSGVARLPIDANFYK